MEVIKKRISLEQFKSRIPALIDNVDTNKDDSYFQKMGVWGDIPRNIRHEGLVKELTFEEFMTIYKKLMDVVINSSYYEYDDRDKKWITLDFDWRNIFGTNINYKYVNFLPEKGAISNCVYGVTTIEGEKLFNEASSELTTFNNDGKYVIELMNSIIGREIIPPTIYCNDCGHLKMGYLLGQCEKCNSDNTSLIQGQNVPYLMYWVEIPYMIDLLEELKNKDSNCCDKINYEKYGGDAFYNYLNNLLTGTTSMLRWDSGTKTWGKYEDEGEIPSININVLLTGKNVDLGVYKSYDVDVIDENNNVSNEDAVISNSGVVKTIGESKLKTLRRRKFSVDDSGNELPGILKKGRNNSLIVELPYPKGRFKNVKYIRKDDGTTEIYGDVIHSITESIVVKEITENEFNAYTGETSSSSVRLWKYGTISKPIENVVGYSYTNNVDKGDELLEDIIANNINLDVSDKIKILVNSLKSKINNVYKDDDVEEKILMIKHDYLYRYNIKHKNGTSTHISSGSTFVSITDATIEFIYVLGGKAKKEIIDKGDGTNDYKLVLDNKEVNPFELKEESLKTWGGFGIWYKEKYPLIVGGSKKFMIDNVEKELTYKEIDFNSKESSSDIDNLDFKRKNYILCDSMIYRSESYKQYATNDVIFKDEKMTNVNFPFKEKYDITIDRGSVAAFEKHIQLTDIKTWEDLENYRNGMFLK